MHDGRKRRKVASDNPSSDSHEWDAVVASADESPRDAPGFGHLRDIEEEVCHRRRWTETAKVESTSVQPDPPLPNDWIDKDHGMTLSPIMPLRAPPLDPISVRRKTVNAIGHSATFAVESNVARSATKSMLTLHRPVIPSPLAQGAESPSPHTPCPKPRTFGRLTSMPTPRNLPPLTSRSFALKPVRPPRPPLFSAVNATVSEQPSSRILPTSPGLVQRSFVFPGGDCKLAVTPSRPTAALTSHAVMIEPDAIDSLSRSPHEQAANYQVIVSPLKKRRSNLIKCGLADRARNLIKAMRTDHALWISNISHAIHQTQLAVEARLAPSGVSADDALLQATDPAMALRIISVLSSPVSTDAGDRSPNGPILILTRCRVLHHAEGQGTEKDKTDDDNGPDVGTVAFVSASSAVARAHASCEHAERHSELAGGIRLTLNSHPTATLARLQPGRMVWVWEPYTTVIVDLAHNTAPDGFETERHGIEKGPRKALVCSRYGILM